MPGAGDRIVAGNPGGAGAAKAPLYEQQAPLEEWQHGGTQTAHRAQEDQSTRPMEQQLHKRQPQVGASVIGTLIFQLDGGRKNSHSTTLVRINRWQFLKFRRALRDDDSRCALAFTWNT